MAEMGTWRDVRLPDGAELLRKELFSYRVDSEWFDIELFENRDGQYYAIGTPGDKTRLIVYGSAVTADPQRALEQALQKINRDHFQQEIMAVGEDRGGDGPTDEGGASVRAR